MTLDRIHHLMIGTAVLAGGVGLILSGHTKPSTPPLPRMAEQNGRYALMVDGAPYLILGAQVNNSSAWPATLPKVWPAIEAMHANTVELPIYWEQMEPRPGSFDFSLVDTILTQGRAHRVRLILLWFGTWKNGSAHYEPEWMKSDPARFPRVMNEQGRFVDSPAPQAAAALEADKRAFGALMGHLKAADPQHTVVMIQVENETGTYGSVRDYSPNAQKFFEGQAPEKLVNAMHKKAGTWQEAFGEDADEYFHAWSIASYVGQVAAAGKAIYGLPMYTNAALRDPLHPGKASTYESGGPTDNVIPIWRAAAPALDFVAPDIYMNDSARVMKVMELYHRADNALFIPEIGSNPTYSRYFFTALGHQAIGFSPFGIDFTGYVNFPLGAARLSEETLAPFAMNYELMEPMQGEIARLNFEGILQAVAEEQDRPTQGMDFGFWKATVAYGLPSFGFGQPKGNAEPTGRALVAQLGPNQFLVTGFFCRVDFRPSDDAAGKQRQFIRVEEGAYVNGTFERTRILNGDQTDYGLNFTSAPQVLRVTLGTF